MPQSIKLKTMSKFFEKYFSVKNENEGGFSIAPIWEEIEKLPEFSVLKGCNQSPRWHSEGNAYIHTQNVVNEAIKYVESTFKEVNEIAVILVLSALFHDIGKGVTTFEKNGTWHSYGHEIEGEKITRKLLWDEGYRIRENICALVRWHMEPMNWFKMNNGILEKIVEFDNLFHKLGPVDFRKDFICISDLLRIKCWDLNGSIQEDEQNKNKDLYNLQRLIDLADNMNLNKARSLYNFAVNKHFKIDDRKPLILITFIGLPGAGKDTYISKLYPDYDTYNVAVLSRDKIRAELGFCKEGEKIVGTSEQEKEVNNVFNERLLDAAKKGKTIIINNLNLKAKYREETMNKLSNYNVKSIYFYVEAYGLDKNKERRKGQISDDAFNNMIMNFDWPKPSEYDTFFTVTT